MTTRIYKCTMNGRTRFIKRTTQGRYITLNTFTGFFLWLFN